MENVNELQYIKEKVANIENIVFSGYKNQKLIYNLLVEYKSYLCDLDRKNKEQNDKITSLDNKINKLLELINNEISGDTPSSKKCQYSDKQLYEMHYGIGYKKKYSLADLVGLTGMSKSFVQQHIRKYNNKLNKEV